MTARIRHDNVRAADLLAADHLPTCVDCGDLNHPTATRCESCGSPLFPKNSNGSGRSDLDGTSAAGAERRTIPMVKDCTCGGNGICVACVLAEYDGDPFAVAAQNGLRLIHDALDRGNVVSLHGHSMRAPRAEL